VVEEIEPHPLPNLEHKIMQGNSLISEYEGVKLFDESFLEETNHLGKERAHVEARLSELQREYFALHSRDALTPVKKEEFERQIRSLNKRKKVLNTPSELQGQELSIFDAPGQFQQEQVKADQLRKKIELYVSESQRTKKQKLKDEIEQLKWDLIEASLKNQGKIELLANVKSLKKHNIKPFFVWKLEFGDVFQEKGGFDVVIANPPYVGEKGNKDIFQQISRGNLGKFYLGKVDLFYFFFHLALELGRKNSTNAFITTNYFVTASGARILREDLRERAIINNLINFNELKIFASATGQHNMITIFSKGSGDSTASTCVTSHKGTASPALLHRILSKTDNETSYFSVKQSALYDGVENYIRASGLGNVDNPVERILSKISGSAFLLGDVCNVNIGMRTGADKLSPKYISEYGINFPKNTGIYVLSDDEVESLNLTPQERSLVVPFFKNSDIRKYYSKTKNTLWLIDVSYPKRTHLPKDQFPNIVEHLESFRLVLEGRKSNDNGLQAVLKAGHWWAYTMRQIDFSQPKIVAPQRSKKNDFGYNEVSWHASMDVYYITEKANSKFRLKYILALLNSKPYYQWLYHRGKRKGEALELYQKPLSEVPIIEASDQVQSNVESIVDQILTITEHPDYNPASGQTSKIELEKRIDDIFCGLLDLSDDERALIGVV